MDTLYFSEFPAAFVIPDEPKSKSRPQFRRTGKAYTPASTRKAEKAVAECCDRDRESRGFTSPPDGEHTIGVSMIFHLKSKRKRDIDNLVKLVLDGLNGHAWADDSQVSEIYARLVHGAAVPRTEVQLYITGRLPDEPGARAA